IHSPRRNVNRVVRQGTGTLRNCAYHGVAIFGPKLVQQMARPGAFDLIEALLQAIEQGAQVHTFHAGDGFWGTTGSLPELQRLEQSLQANPRVLSWFTP
ncbi:MAG TPA: hypothetical protein VF678_09350, partial [bacterium]